MRTWDQIVKLLDETNSKNVLIVCHKNADPDAVGSAQSLRNLIMEYCPSISQVGIVAEDVNQISKRMMELYPEITVAGEITFKPDAFILVDVNSIEHTGKFASIVGGGARPIIIIDHHVPQTKSNRNVALKLVDEDASSTAEIVSSLSESVGRKPTKTEATILLTGIIYDSKRFSRIGKDVFHAANLLVDAGGDYKSALSVLKHTTERSEKIARLKAAQRAKVVEIGGWIVTCSSVSSFGASACRALIDLGSDVAIVTSKKKKDTRMTARSSSIFYETARLNLAKLMEKIGIELGGHGGGHATAATVSGIEDANQGERLILRYIEEHMHKISGVLAR
jgi:nanoRNase/pAp phosphatase (c-di-AMP/oligoRNAs hydrolase)